MVSPPPAELGTPMQETWLISARPAGSPAFPFVSTFFSFELNLGSSVRPKDFRTIYSY